MTTQDGYILGLQRIPRGRIGGVTGGGAAAARQPVLLQHGVLVVRITHAWHLTFSLIRGRFLANLTYFHVLSTTPCRCTRIRLIMSPLFHCTFRAFLSFTDNFV